MNILDIDPDNGHVWFRGDFDDSWLWSKGYVIEDMVLFEGGFDVVRGEPFLRIGMREERDAGDLEIRFGFG